MSFTLGVIISDVKFVRPVGDVGNSATYNHPVIIHVAKGVTAAEMVRPEPNPALVESYLAGALELQRRGAQAITTTCGFLSPIQDFIARQLHVPFVASSLLLVPFVYSLVRGRVGIITANDESLTRTYLAAAGVPSDVPVGIIGLQRYEQFAAPFLRDEGEVDIAKVETAVADGAQDLLNRHSDIKAFLCECHNLAPFSAAIQRRVNKPVFDILNIVSMLAQSWEKRVFIQSATHGIA